ncbi:MAG: DUF5103 domain-containing protein [Tannerella sp.]|jgi:hypothetical protein|nr:DUF5103 domain-containing protein [Tannerella sp.]
MYTYKYILTAITGFVLVCGYVDAQETYRTEIFRDHIKSLEIKVEGELISSPYIELKGEKRIEITFDALHRSSGRYAYSVIHCDADWKKSVLSPIEYMNGFQQVTVNDFANSINTMTHYTNYKICFPNEDTRFTMSGNYAVQVYEEDNMENIILTACFSLIESLIDIEASVSGNTDIDFNREHQQIDFTIYPQNLNIVYPQNDLKIFVYQNNNRNDVRTDIQPMTVTGEQIQYTHNRKLIFEAGNEYRRIEFLTHRYNGMGVEETGFYNPYYHATLFREKKRAKTSYLYDQDQNGRFFIRCSECQDPDTEADYYVVHFSLASEPMSEGDVYITGELFNNINDHRNRMEYNAETGAYEKAVMLKLGLYNYQYAFMGKGGAQTTLKETEGNFFETENEYLIAVYYRPAGARYDRLIGAKSVSNSLTAQ